MAALMVIIIIINFIVPANNTQKTLEIVLAPVMTSKKQVIATTDSNCWQVVTTQVTGCFTGLHSSSNCTSSTEAFSKFIRSPFLGIT